MLAYTVVNHTPISSALIARAELVIEGAAREVRRWWGTPLIAFRRAGGWRIDFEPLGYAQRVCGAPACHGVSRGRPTALVGNVTNRDDLTLLFSHEVFEMTADPFLRRPRREICDPVDGLGHFRDGIYIAAFVTPRRRVINR